MTGSAFNEAIRFLSEINGSNWGNCSLEKQASKRNTKKWFDGGVLNLLRNLRIWDSKELHKKLKHDALKLIASKSKPFLKEKLSETIAKPKNYGDLLNLWVYQTK